MSRRTVTRECPCGDAMTVTTDGDRDFIDGLFEHFDELHADCPTPCPRCEGTGRTGGTSRGRYLSDTCSECNGSGTELTA